MKNDLFAKRFAEAVNSSGMNYSEIAKTLGLSRATVSMYKSGKALPSVDTLSNICNILDVSADYLLGLNEYHL